MQIFSSNFTLSFKEPQIESEFKKYTLLRLQMFNGALALFSFVTFVVSTILMAHYYANYPTQIENYLLFWSTYYSSIVLTCLVFVSVILVYALRNNFLVHKIILIFNYIVIYLSLSYIRYYVLLLIKLDISVFYFIHFCEFIVRALCICLGIMGFIEALITGLCLILLFLVYYSPITPWWKVLPYSFLFYSIFLIITIVIGYFFCRELRVSFCYKYKLEKNNKWYETVINASSSGFVKISNGRITYLNRKILEYIRQNDNTAEIFTFTSQGKPELDAINDKSHLILHELLGNIYTGISQENYSGEHITATEDNLLRDYLTLLQDFKDRYLLSKETNFFLLGFKDFPIRSHGEPEILTFEVFFRYYKDCGENLENCEFIFNDITRTKIIEKKNAEFKYKSLYLSKIAHEFKNPLICITELIDKCKDTYSSMKKRYSIKDDLDKKFDNNLFLIKSLSNYLVILIKDLDYFSESQVNGKNQINLAMTNLDELVGFVDEIAKGMLMKYEKHNKINFVVLKDIKISKFLYTDEVRLKQILINLASNAIKFTKSGKISLELQTFEKFLKICIKDTGIGIRPEIQKKLFKPFVGEKSNNNLGTGLGLGIVHDITSKLGMPIQFVSHVDKGSKFWFYLPYLNQEYTPITSDLEYQLELNNLHNRFCEDETVRSTDSRLSKTLTRSKGHQTVHSYVEMSTQRYMLDSEREDCMIDIRPDPQESSYETIKIEPINLALSINMNLSGFSPRQVNTKKVNQEIEMTSEYDYYAIVADDESFVRGSTIRVLKKVMIDKNLRVNFLEAEDGIEILYLLMKNLNSNRKIDLIISDETMNYCGGRETLGILEKLTAAGKISNVPFCIVSAGDSNELGRGSSVYPKPLAVQHAVKILESLSHK